MSTTSNQQFIASAKRLDVMSVLWQSLTTALLLANAYSWERFINQGIAQLMDIDDTTSSLTLLGVQSLVITGTSIGIIFISGVIISGGLCTVSCIQEGTK